MKIIICGAGQVGYGIAERLAAEKNDVSVIDVVPQLIHRLRDSLDVKGFVGHGSHPDVLEAAGIAEADILIAATLYDEVNIVACEVAHAIFDVPMKIARIRAHAYLQLNYINFSREHLPIDAIIYPEKEVAEMILERISLPGAHDVVQFIDDKIIMLSIKCTEKCPIIQTPFSRLSHMFPDLLSTVVGIQRNGTLFIAHSNDYVLPNDLVYIISRKDQVRRTLNLFQREEPEFERIVLAGGGNIGLYVAKELEKTNINVKIIEHNLDRANKTAADLVNTIVLKGSAVDQKILLEAEVQDSDLIVSLTNNDQVNILSALMAKQMGCKKSLSLINEVSYLDLAQSIGVDSYINPGNVTISRVLPHVRQGRIRGVYSFDKGIAEIIEAEAIESSSLVGMPLAQLNLPSGIRIGAVYREGECIRPSGSLCIKPKDRVIIFCLANAIKDLEQLFCVNIDFF